MVLQNKLTIVIYYFINSLYSISFLALKYLLRYKTCQTANPNKQDILKILK